MLPSRFVPQQQSNMRKSRLEGKPSLLPKPRRPGSTDRLSTEARRPSTAGHRSSSAEPPRATFGARLSREASATKIAMNGRSRSQQSDRFGQAATTPLRSNHHSRSTTTPVRTPSEDRSSRNWQTSLERALAFVTTKDQRPISNVAWQRAECGRVQAALAAGGGGMALIRPLTIARFVDITGALLASVIGDAKLNNDNYITKLPHLSKRLLYPGTVSKSWLRTVNTLHAFPHALALIAYLLDLVSHIEMPVSDDWLYLGKDELSCLRRDYLYKCWIRFQDPGHQFEDLNEDYLQNLKTLLGNDEEKIVDLKRTIQKYEACLEDEVELAARADEARRTERRGALAAALRTLRSARAAARGEADAQRALHRQGLDEIKHLEADTERAHLENEELSEELERQSLSVAERARLLDEVDYARRVQDSKRALADQIAKMVLTKENELALWQKRTLDSCVEYKQGLIHLSAQHPDVAELAIDENQLMCASCAEEVARAVERLRERASLLGLRRARAQRDRAALARRTHALSEEIRAKISEAKCSAEREQQALDGETAREAAEAATWSRHLQDLADKMDELRAQQEHYAQADRDLQFWEKQELAWRSKLTELREYTGSRRGECARLLARAGGERARRVAGAVGGWARLLQH